MGKINKEIPSSRELLPDRERIIAEVCRFYGVKDIDIIKKRRGTRNEVRNAAIYLTRNLRMDTYSEIGKQYGIDNDRTVRSVFVRMKKTLNEDKNLARKIKKVEGFNNKESRMDLTPFLKSQEWT